ncbi:MAG: Ppx/GppA phosphatase family protein [Porphyromonas sp.]
MKDKIHYAGIDIGSNAVRLLIKCLNEESSEELLSKVQLVRVPIRLGEDAFMKGRIGKKKSKKLISLMRAYKELMEIYDVSNYRACATSAMRDADNGLELVQAIEQEVGIKIEIISGREEAQLISQDLINGADIDSEATFLYVDVGGGSTELNLVRHGELLQSHSFNIGTIRQLSGKVEQEEVRLFESYLAQIKESYGEVQVVGSGGNINKLLRLGAPAERAKVNFLKYANLQSVYDELVKYTSEERMMRFRLKPDRADVIIPAAEIFLLVGRIICCEKIIVPTKGLSDGIIESIYKEQHSITTPII